MWYLITFEKSEILTLITNQTDMEHKIIGTEDGKPVVSISPGEKKYEIEIVDNTPDVCYLNQFNALNPIHFTVLNHSTVILKWDFDLQSLIAELPNILNRGDKYVIIPFTEIAASNMLNAKFYTEIIKNN